MQKSNYTKDEIINAIIEASKKIGKRPSRSEFLSITGIREYHVLKHFQSWNEAIQTSGFEPDTTNIKVDDGILLEDWGNVVRELKQIPTRIQYRKYGKYSPGTFEKHFGPWTKIPELFKIFAKDKIGWKDVLLLLPPKETIISNIKNNQSSVPVNKNNVYSKLDNRPVYGNPIDFRGLRHEPVNENGVVFLFGIVARELGYSVEAIQSGFPDCEAKRQISPGKWQRVKIEFEYESRNFRDHGHSSDRCDIIICWKHNWSECPEKLEVIELSSIIKQLGKSDEY